MAAAHMTPSAGAAAAIVAAVIVLTTVPNSSDALDLGKKACASFLPYLAADLGRQVIDRSVYDRKIKVNLTANNAATHLDKADLCYLNKKYINL
jgi:hypothetical protein